MVNGLSIPILYVLAYAGVVTLIVQGEAEVYPVRVLEVVILTLLAAVAAMLRMGYNEIKAQQKTSAEKLDDISTRLTVVETRLEVQDAE